MDSNLSAFLVALAAATYRLYSGVSDSSGITIDSPPKSSHEIYDFIVVGAGSAGSVVASRLTENPDWKVLLIEAGGDYNYISDTPILHSLTYETELDWNYTTVRQDKACLSTGGVCKYPLGHVMGGSSGHHGILYSRGNKEDYDDWAKRGNTGWDYKNVLPYFIKAENNTEPSLSSSQYHGNKGPLNVQYPRYVTKFREHYLEAAEELGWRIGDYNGEHQDVTGYAQVTIDGASTESTAKAYLDPVSQRKNLIIHKNTIATRVIITRNTAKGVEFIRDGQTYKAYAMKEVILSAGSVNTPKLLMLSGVGPKEHLKEHNIEVHADLPVGKNLQDHLHVPVTLKINETGTLTPDVWQNEESIEQYVFDKKGPLSTPTFEAMAFINPINKSEQPNIQYTFASSLVIGTAKENENILQILVSNVKPKSVGNIRLKSSDWKDAPLINPNYFSDPRDYDVFHKGVEELLEYIKTPTMASLSATLYTEIHPNCHGKPTKDLIKCLIYQYSGTNIFHPTGTAWMGEKGKSVVNHNLQVHGIRNLMVVDASVMPNIPGGNTNAPTIMIAEKGSDLIKKRYSVK